MIQASAFAAERREYQSFPLDTDPKGIELWQRQKRAELELRYGGARQVVAGTFAADAKRYLGSVTALPDYSGRESDINIWVVLFRDRRRHTIKPSELRAQRDTWLTIGPKRKCVKGQGWVEVKEGLAPATVSKRMRALENMWTVLDGRHAYNPVREVPEPQEDDAEPRGLPYALVEAILSGMPDRGPGLRDQPRAAVSKTKARLRLMAYTGVTQKQMMALQETDFRYEPPAIRRPKRSKGKGAKGGWVPVPAEAVPAMRAFADADAWGDFSVSAMHSAFRRACKRLRVPGLDKLKPYDLRHSIATKIVGQTGDVPAAQQLLQHASIKTTLKYAEAARDEWLAAAMAKVTGLRPRPA